MTAKPKPKRHAGMLRQGDPFESLDPGHGPPVGVFLWPFKGWSIVCTIDADGQLVELKRLPTRAAVRWSLTRHMRVHLTMAEFVQSMVAGHVTGWVYGFFFELRFNGRLMPIPAIPLIIDDLHLQQLATGHDLDQLKDEMMAAGISPDDPMWSSAQCSSRLN